MPSVFFDRLFRTVGKAFSDPVSLFSGLQPDDIGAPLVYGTLVGTVGTLFGILWNMVFGGMAMLGEGAAVEQFAFGTGFYVVMWFSAPCWRRWDCSSRPVCTTWR